MRVVAFWGLFWGPVSLGNYHICRRMESHVGKEMDNDVRTFFR